MSVVIVGGNERMEYQYKEICKNFGCRVKIFTKMPADFKRKIGSPNLVILFTNTVSHKMVTCAVQEAARANAVVARCHSSSSCALKELLQCHCNQCQEQPCCSTCETCEKKSAKKQKTVSQ